MLGGQHRGWYPHPPVSFLRICWQRPVPGHRRADLLAWDMTDPQGTGVIFRPFFGEMLGPPDSFRRSGFKNARMSVIIKTHKSPIEDRNVVRLFNNNFSASSQLLRRMLEQLLEEEKTDWESQGLVFPVLRNTRHYHMQIGHAINRGH